MVLMSLKISSKIMCWGSKRERTCITLSTAILCIFDPVHLEMATLLAIRFNDSVSIYTSIQIYVYSFCKIDKRCGSCTPVFEFEFRN